MKRYQAKPMITNKYLLGESPYYDKKKDTFSWVDIIAGKFYRMKDRNISCLEFGEQIGAAILTDVEDTYIVAGTKAIYEIDKDNKKKEIFDGFFLLPSICI